MMLRRSTRAHKQMLIACLAVVAISAAWLRGAHGEARSRSRSPLVASFGDQMGRCPVHFDCFPAHFYFKIFGNGTVADYDGLPSQKSAPPTRVISRRRIPAAAAWGIVTLAYTLNDWQKQHFLSVLETTGYPDADRVSPLTHEAVTIRGEPAVPQTIPECDFQRASRLSRDLDFDEVDGVLQALTRAKFSCLGGHAGLGDTSISFGIYRPRNEPGMIVRVSRQGTVGISRLYCKGETYLTTDCREKQWVGALPAAYGGHIYPGAISAVEDMVNTVGFLLPPVHPQRPAGFIYLGNNPATTVHLPVCAFLNHRWSGPAILPAANAPRSAFVRTGDKLVAQAMALLWAMTRAPGC